ncbi:DUF5333 domain-containing protein [uncultured Lentibacter sp.]|uniref:DUF5333 domain-containing protein n=1 Tax=uncultured Lentibacter sp. TaxID=1659309 RepID=UPI00262DDF8C|nr:DUF5333 domain-containing protein [uncultured Lentibacter sp.]
MSAASGLQKGIVQMAVRVTERLNVWTRIVVSAVVAGGLFGGTMAAAKPNLRDVREIDDQMLNVGLALIISRECDSITERKLKGLAFLWELKRRANALGYSDDEINAYRKSEAEKARLRAAGEDYVKSKGLNPKDAADLCKLGTAEIEKGSTIGSLLRAK